MEHVHVTLCRRLRVWIRLTRMKEVEIYSSILEAAILVHRLAYQGIVGALNCGITRVVSHVFVCGSDLARAILVEFWVVCNRIGVALLVGKSLRYVLNLFESV